MLYKSRREEFFSQRFLKEQAVIRHLFLKAETIHCIWQRASEKLGFRGFGATKSSLSRISPASKNHKRLPVLLLP